MSNKTNLGRYDLAGSLGMWLLDGANERTAERAKAAKILQIDQFKPHCIGPYDYIPVKER